MKSSTRKSRGRAMPGTANAPSPVGADRSECIATAAYFKAKAREFLPGLELEDWLKAEAEFDAREGS